MANRNFNRHQSLEKEIKSLYLDVAIGASGAPTLTAGLGTTSIARTATGRYDITLDDKYTRLMSMSLQYLNSTSSDLTSQLTAEDVNGAKTVSFATKAAAVDADPADGDRLLIRLDLKNSSSGE